MGEAQHRKMKRPVTPEADAVELKSPLRPSRYAWLALALVFGLLWCDYMSRQVLNAVYRLLKAVWTLFNGQHGWLSGIVALTVGVLQNSFIELAK